MGQLQAQMKHRDAEMVPRFLVQAMFALMIASVGMVSLAVLTGRAPTGAAQISPVVQEVTLRMEGTRNGNVTVFNEAGQIVARSEDDKNGFIGVIWRVMYRERMLHGIKGPLHETTQETAPVRVVRRENGHIAVLDTVTDWSVELIGYGQDNVAAFARLVD